MAAGDTMLVAAVVERSLRSWWPYMPVFLARLVDPIVMLFAYGLAFAGMATVIGVPLEYRTYMYPGLIGYMLFHALIIDSTYLPYTRCFHYRLWPAMLATPVRLEMILAGEQIFNVFKGLIFCLLMLLVGLCFNAVPSIGGFFLMLPVAIVFMLAVTAIGNWMTSAVRTDWDFDFIWPVVATPMLALSGVFYDMHLFPEWVQQLVWVFPLWHFIEVARPIMFGGELNWMTLIHIAMLVLVWLGCSWLAYRGFYRKLYS